MRIFYFPVVLASIATRFPKSCLLIATLLTLGAAGLASRIELRNDFVELLPDHMPEVKVIRDVLYKSGGLGYQAVMVSSRNRDANRAFLKQLKQKLSLAFRDTDALPFADAIQDKYERLGGMLRDIYHYGRNPSPYWKQQISGRIKHFEQSPLVEYAFSGYDLSFFSKHQLLMVSAKDLKTIHKRLQRKISYEVKKRQMGDMSLLTADEKPKDPGIDLSDIQRKYKKQLNSLPSRIEVQEKDQWYAALIIRPRGIATDIIFTTEFVKRLKSVVKDLKKAPAFAGLSTDFIGGFTGNLREVHGIARDLTGSILSTIVLLLVLLLLFFRRVRVLWLIPIPLAMGFAWTFAFAYVAIGYLNTATSFIGVLLLGLGIDYGIYLVHRYFQERRAGKSPEQAIADTYFWTGKSVSTAAATTAVGFFALLLCRFRGFSEFGLIAGMGIFLCLIAMSTALPAMLILMDRWRPMMPAGPLFKLPELQRGFPFATLFVLLAFVVIVGAVASLPKVPFESNMKKLGFQDNGLIQQTKKWQRFDKIFPQSSMNPVVFFAHSASEARYVRKELLRRSKLEQRTHKNPETLGIRRALDAFQFVPGNQQQKQVLIGKIKDLLKRNTIEDWVEDDPKLEKVYRTYKPLLNVQSFVAEDLPLYLQRDLVLYDKDRFDKTAGYMVVVVSGYDLSDGLQAGKLHQQLKGMVWHSSDKQLSKQRAIQPSGEPIIFAELLHVIDVDSLKAILFSLLAVALLVLFDLRSIKLTMLSLWPIITGLLGVSILLVFFDIRLSLFNMVVLPALLGINVDAGVHMLHRYRESPELGTLGVQLDLMGAITIASMTTVISFASLITAHHQGMRSVGSLAIAGLASGLIGSLVFLPALMESIFRRFPLKRFIER